MNIFFEEDGSFKSASIMADNDTSLQIELPTGKRSKIKANTVRLRFETPAPAEFMALVAAEAEQLDINFVWECAPQAEFKWQDLALEYFGAGYKATQGAALLSRIHAAPAYFYRKGTGVYRPAPPEVLQAAIAAIARKEQQEKLKTEWAAQMVAGTLPTEIAAHAAELLFAPDKNSTEFKALDAACAATGQTPARLMLALGAFKNEYAIHRSAFIHAHFPQGVKHKALSESLSGSLNEGQNNPRKCPKAHVRAFSIDDASTTEIDDAFSVEFLAEGTYRIGIHIAAPALGIAPDDGVDVMARKRLSTVYTPGEKITMLPDAVVEAFTLKEGQECPALSLYLSVNAQFEITDYHTVQDRVFVAHNLRHNDLDECVTVENLAANAGEYPCKAELAVLWPLAKWLLLQRETVKGKPDVHNRTDYNFYVEDDHVKIVARKRGAPLDLIVAELMICANQHWGGLLDQVKFAGIYRSQETLSGVKKTRMTSHAAPHEGLGVAQYAWCTSPLRRYPDLVNQWQLLAHLDGRTPTFSQKSVELYSIIGAFESASAAYAEQQDKMERYWCLRWLQQEGKTQITATALREEILRADELPLIIKLATFNQARGTQVLLDILAIDLLDLSLEVRVHSVLTQHPSAGPVASPAEIELEPSLITPA